MTSFRKLFNKITLPVLAAIFFATACDRNENPCLGTGNDYSQSDDSYLHFRIESPNGNNLIGANFSTYEDDEVTVIKENGETADSLYISGDGNLSLDFTHIEDPIDTDIEKMFYVVFPPIPSFPEVDYDTLIINYTLREEAPCFIKAIDDFSVEYNGEPANSEVFPQRISLIKQ